jgi:hypothetical protein
MAKGRFLDSERSETISRGKTGGRDVNASAGSTIALEASTAVSDLWERRTPLFVRIRTDMPAALVDLTSGHAIHGRVENVSIGGMYFTGTDTLEVGERVLCALIRTDGEYQDEFYTNGTVVHRHAHGVGIAFDGVTPFAFTVISEMVEAAGCFQVLLEVGQGA